MKFEKEIFELQSSLDAMKICKNKSDFIIYNVNGQLVSDIRTLASEVGKSQILAENFWNIGDDRAKVLAVFLAEYSHDNIATIFEWISITTQWYILELFAQEIFEYYSVPLEISEKLLTIGNKSASRVAIAILRKCIKNTKQNDKVYDFLLSNEFQDNIYRELLPQIKKLYLEVSKISLANNSRILKIVEENTNLKSMESDVLYWRIVIMLKNYSDVSIKNNMKRIGIKTESCYGVSLINLRKIAKEFQMNHKLAKKLFVSKVHEMRVLATMIEDPIKVSLEQIRKLGKGFDSWDICDLTCRNLIEKTKYADTLINEWCNSEEEYLKRAGFVLIARMAIISAISNEDRQRYYLLIKKGCMDNRNFVKKAVCWAVRQIGKSSTEALYETLYLCNYMKNLEFSSAKWISNTALIELKKIQIKKGNDEIMIEKNFLEKRDPICLSHYPPLSKTRTVQEVQEGMGLENNNMVNSNNGTIYIHIPFCDKICQFCPFNKVLKDEKKVEKYLDSLYKEIKYYAKKKYIQDTIFESIAFGGGTPSCLSSEQLVNIILKIKGSFRFKRDIEIAIEGNPENYTYEKMEATFRAGVNRISLGIQTFNPKCEGILKLQHTIQEGIEAIENAHELGCNNVGIDLMYNIPGQTDEELENDILKAIELEVEHITLFAMTTPPNTKFKKEIDVGNITNIGNKEREIHLYQLAEKILISAGYEQYSVYDFILPNKLNLHAYNYFSRQSELLGLGAAAFGYLNGYMYINHGELGEYNQLLAEGNPPVLYGEKATEKDKMYGTLAKGLRLLKVSKQRFFDRFNKQIEDVFAEQIVYLKSLGLIEIDEYNIYLTKMGILYGNNVCKAFISDDRKEATGLLRNILTKGVRKEDFKK